MSALETERFTDLLSRLLGGYRTRNQNLAACVAGLLASRTGPVRMPQVAEVADCNPGAFRRLLDDGDIDEGALRRALVAAVPAADLHALVVETSYVTIVEGDDGNGRQIFSLHALGEGTAVPIGWSTVRSPPPGTEPLSVVEAEALVELVSQAGHDYDAVEPGALSATGGRPVLVLDPWYGSDPRLRAALGRIVAEYSVAVDGNDVLPHTLRRELYESVDTGRSVAEHFHPLPQGEIALAREILDGSHSRHGREYATATRRSGAPTYAIVRPYVPAAPGALLGSRPERRAAEIAAFAGLVEERNTAARLRVSDFFHPNIQGVRREALLASLFDTMRAGILPRRTR